MQEPYVLPPESLQRFGPTGAGVTKILILSIYLITCLLCVLSHFLHTKQNLSRAIPILIHPIVLQF